MQNPLNAARAIPTIIATGTMLKPPLNRDGEPRAFFGRKAGKRLYARQQALFDSLLPTLSITAPKTGHISVASLFPNFSGKLILEIGYGGGEHLARQAQAQPDAAFVGCEVFTGGIGKLLEKIDYHKLQNIRLYTDDAIKLLNFMPDASIDETYLLYPDPWPKFRHRKRRFISPLTLAALGRIIKPGGLLHVATDIEDYANWTLAHIVRDPHFTWTPSAPGDWHQPFPDWQPTRYEVKARAEGRLQSFYFTFHR